MGLICGGACYTARMHGEWLWKAADEEALRAARAALDVGDLTAALLAVEAAGPEAVAATRRRLAEWTDAVRALGTDQSPPYQAAVLRHVLVDRGGLRGDSETYHDPQNCHLSAVIARGRGMPILLSAVWMIVGARAGIPVAGIGMPAHFIARVGGPDGQLVDPFASGRPLTIGHCRSIVEKLTAGKQAWHERFLDECSLDDLLARVLRNIQLCHQQAGEHHALYRAARLTAGIFPDRVMFQLIHAQVAELIEATPMAIALYEDVLRRFPGDDIVLLARRRLEQLTEDAPQVH